MTNQATMPMPTTLAPGVVKLEIQKEAVCLSVKFGMLGTRRRIATESITTDADESMVHVAKDILESVELKRINQHRTLIRAYLDSRCLPSPFRAGVYLIRLSAISEVMDEVTRFEKIFFELVDQFVTFYQVVFDSRHDETSELRTRLGSLYDPGDYPTPEQVKKAFRFETSIWELGTPGALKAVNKALYDREVKKMENVWEQAKETVTNVMLSELRDMTARLTDRLTPGADGKVKIFRDSVVGNLQEWLDVFDKRALSDDTTLLASVQRARALVNGIDPRTLRDGEAYKKELASEMKSLTEQLDKAIIERPGRQINLNDEEAS